VKLPRRTYPRRGLIGGVVAFALCLLIALTGPKQPVDLVQVGVAVLLGLLCGFTLAMPSIEAPDEW
jgi:hypothetical protein